MGPWKQGTFELIWDAWDGWDNILQFPLARARRAKIRCDSKKLEKIDIFAEKNAKKLKNPVSLALS